uniref:Uncharacterized protein n=1 Tax=Ananas comosus var. bracteatus TaxID=296719 RepID=A0A6V7NJ74_ANACO|nr:unnamed protein product [Ananas comosus var. bracteatus]
MIIWAIRLGCRDPNSSSTNPFGNAFYGAGSGFIRTGLGAYGEKWLVRAPSSCKAILAHTSPTLSIIFKPVHPFMAFGTYVILAGFSLGFLGNPEALSLQFTRGLAGWLIQIALLKDFSIQWAAGRHLCSTLRRTAGTCSRVSAYPSSLGSCGVTAITSCCLGRVSAWDVPGENHEEVLFTEMRSYDRHSSRQHYLLLFMAIAQIPLFFWLESRMIVIVVVLNLFHFDL